MTALYTIQHEGKTYQLTQLGKVLEGEAEVAAELQETVLKAADKKLLELAKQPTSGRDMVNELAAAPELLEKLTATKSAVVATKEAEAILQNINGKATKETVAELGILLGKHPEIEHMMSEDASKILTNAEKINATQVKAFSKRIDGLKEKLFSLTETGGSRADFKKAILDHGLDAFDHMPQDVKAYSVDVVSLDSKAVGSRFNLKDIVQEISTEADEVRNAAGKAFNAIGDHAENLTARGPKKIQAQEAIKAQEEALKKLAEKHPRFERVIGEVLETHPKNKAISEVSSLNGVLAKFSKAHEGALGSTGEKTGIIKSVGNFFMHSPAKQAELAVKNGGELKFFGKLNKVKAGGALAAGAVLATIVAGVGNKPGKYAEQEAARGQGQQAGMGVA